MPTIKGTASVADSRAREKALKKTKFPRSFGKSVSLEKVNKSVLEQWIEQKVTSILGFEDEIVSSTAINLFLPSDNSAPDPKKAQLDLAGFLGEQAVSFSSELWKLMLEAQAHPSGIPQTLLEAKKKEMTEKMARENQNRQQHMHPSGGRNPRQFDNVNPMPPQRRGPPNQHDGKNNASANARGDPQQNPRDNQQGSSAEAPANGTDQFGRAYPPQRSRNTQRPNSRDQYDRSRPSDFEGSRRGQRRSRSRDRYDHDRDRDYRRRSDDWNRGMNHDSRRPDDRRYDSNRYDDRSGYHRQYDRRRDYRDHDRYRDGDGRRHRSQDYDRIELDNLERRLLHLKKQYSERNSKHDNRAMHRIDQEIRDVQDRIYEVERRRRRYDSSRDNYSRGRTRRSRSRSRSPSYEHRRGGSRRRRSNSTDSERSASTQRSKGDYSTDSGGSDRGSHHSYSPSPERSKRNKGKGSPKRQKRRRSRSYSSSEGSEHSK